MLWVSLALISAAQAVPMPRTPYSALRGPGNICTEFFSVDLRPGETLAWTEMPNFTGGISYVLITDLGVAQIGPWQGSSTSSLSTKSVMLADSRVAERGITDLRDLPNLRGPDGRHMGADYRVFYLLHGNEGSETPISISMFTNNADLVLPAAQQVTPGSLADRQCLPARSDPAMTDDIVHVYP